MSGLSSLRAALRPRTDAALLAAMRADAEFLLESNPLAAARLDQAVQAIEAGELPDPGRVEAEDLPPAPEAL